MSSPVVSLRASTRSPSSWTCPAMATRWPSTLTFQSHVVTEGPAGIGYSESRQLSMSSHTGFTGFTEDDVPTMEKVTSTYTFWASLSMFISWRSMFQLSYHLTRYPYPPGKEMGVRSLPEAKNLSPASPSHVPLQVASERNWLARTTWWIMAPVLRLAVDPSG